MFTDSTPQRIDYLLAFRGVAILGVVLGHAFGIGMHSVGVFISNSNTFSFMYGHQHLDGVRDALYVLTPLIGLNFVILFFVQSGYLMGKVFHDRRYVFDVAGIRHFYANRFLRIAPLLYFNLLVCLMFFPGVAFDLKKILGDFLFVTNFTGRSINLVTWSISHEMQYYLAAPFVFWLFGRKDSTLGFAACLGLALAILLFWPGDTKIGYSYAFLAGYCVNIALRKWAIRVSELIKLLTLVAGSIAINCAYNYLYLWDRFSEATLVIMLVGAVVIFILECPGEFELSRRSKWYAGAIGFWVLAGELTFSIYLWHYPMIVARFGFFDAAAERLAAAVGWHDPAAVIALYHLVELSVVLPITFLVSYATFHLIERRFRPRLYAPAGASS